MHLARQMDRKLFRVRSRGFGQDAALPPGACRWRHMRRGRPVHLMGTGPLAMLRVWGDRTRPARSWGAAHTARPRLLLCWAGASAGSVPLLGCGFQTCARQCVGLGDTGDALRQMTRPVCPDPARRVHESPRLSGPGPQGPPPGSSRRALGSSAPPSRLLDAGPAARRGRRHQPCVALGATWTHTLRPVGLSTGLRTAQPLSRRGSRSRGYAVGQRACWGDLPDARPQGPLRVVCVPGRHEAQEAGYAPLLTRAPYPHTGPPSMKALLSPGRDTGGARLLHGHQCAGNERRQRKREPSSHF